VLARPAGVPTPKRYKGGGSSCLGRVVKSVVVVSLTLGLTAGGIAVYRYVRGDDQQVSSADESVAEATPTSIEPPASWDPRVTDLVTFVETTRGLTFDHPITIDFLPEDQFLALVQTPESDAADPETQEAVDERDAVADALALEGDNDSAASRSAIATTILGFYDPDTDSIAVRGADLTPDVRTTIVHELTHALQGQHFALQLGGPDDFQLRALAEADALRIEDAYTATLTSGDQTTAEEGTVIDPTGEAALDNVPWSVVEASYAPYIIGPALVAHLVQQGGNAAVDGAFSKLPTQKELLDPTLYGNSPAEIDVEVAPPAGIEPFGRREPWGAYDALVMLDAWLPYRTSRDPLDDWSGGARVAYQQGDQICIAFAAQFSSDRASLLFADAIKQWGAASGTNAVATPAGGAVTFSSCERGSAAVEPPHPTLLPSLAVRAEISFLDGFTDKPLPIGIDVGIGHCAARKMIDDPVIAPLWSKPEITDDERTVASHQAQGYVTACLAERGP
jgi:hypothetical protein